MLTFSATRLATYIACPRKYALTYLTEHEERGENIYALNGYAVHKVIEDHYKTDNPRDPLQHYQELMMHRIVDLRSEGNEVQHLDRYADVFKSAVGIFEKFDWEKFKPQSVDDIEVQFNLEFPNKEHQLCFIRGYIDQVHPWGVLDFKTSRDAPKKEVLANNIQFIIYAWAYEQLYGKKPDKVYWVHLRSAKLIEADVVSDEKVDQLRQIIQTILADTTFPPTAWQTKICSYCPFYLTSCIGV